MSENPYIKVLAFLLVLDVLLFLRTMFPEETAFVENQAFNNACGVILFIFFVIGWHLTRQDKLNERQNNHARNSKTVDL